MIYQYLRMFLIEVERPPILEASGSLNKKETRNEYLGRIFSSRTDFVHRQSKLVYIPVGQEDWRAGPVKLGRVGRSMKEVVNEPPEAGFAETELTTWRASNILIDTGDYKDGQKVAMQERGDVGNPLAVFGSLIAHLNRTNVDSGWLIELSPMTEARNFWDVAKQFEGKITAVKFSFVTPNVLGLRSQLNAGLKDARNKNNAHRVNIDLVNQKGKLDIEQENIRDAVEYVSEGGGTAKIKAGRKLVYSSETDKKVVEVEDNQPLAVERKSSWLQVISGIFS